jgi:hypothetical protein
MRALFGKPGAVDRPGVMMSDLSNPSTRRLELALDSHLYRCRDVLRSKPNDGPAQQPAPAGQ